MTGVERKKFDSMLDNIYKNGTYAARNPKWHSEDSEWKASHLFSLLDSGMLTEMRKRGLTIAEIGCGYGGVLAALSRTLGENGIECRCTGYDISATALSEAGKRHPALRLIQDDFRKTEDCYDLGLMVDFLEHVVDPVSFLACARRRFKWILFHIPLDENLYEKAYRFGRYYQYLREDRGHLHYYTRLSAFKLLQDAGMRVIRWKYTPWGTELYRPGGGRIAPVIRLFRKVGMRVCPDLSAWAFGGASLGCLCTPVRNSSEVSNRR